MEKLKNIKDLLIEQARDLYDAEQKQVNALPRMISKATERPLKEALEKHLIETRQHVSRLERAFKIMEEDPKGEVCEAMDGLIRESQELIYRSADRQVLDAGLIASEQHIEHYEIAGYGAACTYAELLGLNEVAGILHESLEEEKKSDKKLTEIAKQSINEKARAPVITRK